MAKRIQAEASENQQNKGNKMKIQFIKKGISFIKIASASNVVFNITREHAYIALWAIVKFLMDVSDGDWIAIKNNVDSAINAYRTERNRANNNLADLAKVEKEATKEINK
jgi:hypothetical protein